VEQALRSSRGESLLAVRRRTQGAVRLSPACTPIESERTGRRLAPASVNRELSILRAILRLAADAECGYLEKAPRVRLEKEPEGQLRYLTDDERAAAPKPPALPGRRDRAQYRDAEVGGLWGSSGRASTSRAACSCSSARKRTREIPMNQAVDDVLSALPRSDNRVYSGRASERRSWGAGAGWHREFPLPRLPPRLREPARDEESAAEGSAGAPRAQEHHADRAVRPSRARAATWGRRDLGVPERQHNLNTKPTESARVPVRITGC